MIYCVIPPELADELFDKLVEYYRDNPNVEVIVDRRVGPDGKKKSPKGDMDEANRRRLRIPGTFPKIDTE